MYLCITLMPAAAGLRHPVAVRGFQPPQLLASRLRSPWDHSPTPFAATDHFTHTHLCTQGGDQDFLGPIATPAELLPLETHRCSHTQSRSLEAPLLPGHFIYSQANLVWSHSHTHTHSGFCTTDPQTHTCTE